MAVERRFRAMGAAGHVVVVGERADALLADACRRIAELEQRWSRFLPTSEVSRLNRAAGSWVEVGEDTHRLLVHAVEAWRLTAGRFDPTILPALLEAGYTADFDTLPAGAAPIGTVPRGTVLTGTMLIVTVLPGTVPVGTVLAGPEAIERRGCAVRLPQGMGFDPGGIGKGLAADLVCEELVAAGAAGVCVNLGGDLRLAGEPPDGTAWTIAVEHEHHPAPLCLLGLRAGAVATSTTLRRRWRGAGGEPRHHLIDPFTGAPSDSDLDHVTVVAGPAWQAEVLAKAVLLRGSDRAFDVIGPGTEALTVDRAGRVRTTPGLQAYLGPDAVLAGPATAHPIQERP
ncbi:MAG: FAD:protein FMN transferase [Acidimicrobiales bacterium]